MPPKPLPLCLSPQAEASAARNRVDQALGRWKKTVHLHRAAIRMRNAISSTARDRVTQRAATLSSSRMVHDLVRGAAALISPGLSMCLPRRPSPASPSSAPLFASLPALRPRGPAARSLRRPRRCRAARVRPRVSDRRGSAAEGGRGGAGGDAASECRGPRGLAARPCGACRRRKGLWRRWLRVRLHRFDHDAGEPLASGPPLALVAPPLAAGHRGRVRGPRASPAAAHPQRSGLERRLAGPAGVLDSVDAPLAERGGRR